MDLSLIISLGVLVGCLIGLSWFAGSDAPFIPTKPENIKKALRLADLKPGEVFYELGSGDGRVVLEAAKMKAKAFGVEQSWLRVWFSRIKAHNLHLKNAHFFHGNIFDRHYYNADVVFIYLLPKGVTKLEIKLRKDLEKGSRVITQTYHFKHWRPKIKEGDFRVYTV